MFIPLFNFSYYSVRPAIDSGLSVTRIGSNAQCKLMKVISVGIKNELTNYRIMEFSENDGSIEGFKLLSLNLIFFQDLHFVSTIEASLILLLVYRKGILFSSSFHIDRLLFLLSFDYVYFYYIVFVTKAFYSFPLYCFLITFITKMFQELCNQFPLFIFLFFLIHGFFKHLIII